MRRLQLILMLTLLVGCPWPINRHNAARYYEIGVEAERSGDLDRAREAFRRAVINADLGRAPPGARALALYEYGRITGYLCLHAEAEEALSESLQLQDGDPEARARLRPPTLLELARLHFDTGRPGEALPYFDEGIALVRPLGVAESDPIRFAQTLEEYAVSLEAHGRAHEARSALDEAAALRAASAGFVGPAPFTRYDTNCGP